MPSSVGTTALLGLLAASIAGASLAAVCVVAGIILVWEVIIAWPQ